MNPNDKQLYDALQNGVRQLNWAIEQARQSGAFALIEISKHEHIPGTPAKRLTVALVRQFTPD